MTSGRDWNRNTAFFTFESGKWLNLPTLQFLELAVPNNLPLMMLSDCSCKLKTQIHLWQVIFKKLISLPVYEVTWKPLIFLSTTYANSNLTRNHNFCSVEHYNVGGKRESIGIKYFSHQKVILNIEFYKKMLLGLSENTFWIIAHLILTYHTKIL